MADTNIDLLTSLMDVLTASIKGLETSLETFVDKLLGSGQEIDSWSQKTQDGANKASRSLEQAASNAERAFGTKVVEKLDKFQEALKGLPNEIPKTTKGLVATGAALVALEAAGLKSLLPVSQGFKTLGESIKGADREATSFSSQVERIGKMGGDLSKFFPTGLKTVMADMAGNVENIRATETALLQLEARSGHLDKALVTIKSDLSGMDQYLDQFSQRMFATAEKTGLTSDVTTGYATALLKIPGAMDRTIEVSKDAGGTMDWLSAAIQVSRGTIQDMDEILKINNIRWEQFGFNGKDALVVISEMSRATNQLGVPFRIINDSVAAVTKQFQFFGDNAEGAIKIMKGLGKALLDSKLGPQAMSEMVQNITQQISNLDIAQKAFLSAQSGGPGGLRGGYQIQQLLQQGDVDKVYRKMEQALRRQFGGRVVGLEEATKDTGAAAQLTRQIAFLQQGPFGKLVGNEAQAIKLLEAIKHGTDPKMATDGEKDLNSAVESGNALQKRQETILSHILNRSERGNQILGQIEYALARQVVGREGGGRMEKFLAEAEKFGQNIALKGAQGQFSGFHGPIEAMKDYMDKLAEPIKDLIVPKESATPEAPEARTVPLPRGQTITPALPPPRTQYQEAARRGIEMLEGGEHREQQKTLGMIHRLGRKTPEEEAAAVKTAALTTGTQGASEANINITIDGQKLVTLAVRESLIKVREQKMNNNQAIPFDFGTVNVKIG